MSSSPVIGSIDEFIPTTLAQLSDQDSNFNLRTDSDLGDEVVTTTTTMIMNTNGVTTTTASHNGVISQTGSLSPTLNPTSHYHHSISERLPRTKLQNHVGSLHNGHVDSGDLNRPSSDRFGKKIPKFWMSKPHTSIFSASGIEAMLERLDQSENASGLNPSTSAPAASRSNGKERTDSGVSSVRGGYLAAVMQPNEVTNEEWEESIRIWEAEGEWIEARETLSGRIMWYNTKSYRLVFDTAPEGVKPVTGKDVTKKLIGLGHEDHLANRPIEPYEGEDVVDALLGFGMHQWDFDNDQVNVYRAVSARKNHKEMLPRPEQYAFPEYFSESPLPEMPGNQFLAKIRLPEEFAAHRRYVTIRIKMDYTTAENAIRQGVEKLDDEHKETADTLFVLKVVGQEEYMYGRRKIVDYEAVRNAVRNEDDVEFALIKRPDFNQRIEEAKEKQQYYTELFKSAYSSKVCDKAFFEEEEIAEKISNGTSVSTSTESNACDFLPETAISLYECDWNYRLKIEGLTNACALPRFEETTMKAFYVVAELWMGDVMFESATLQTENKPARNDIRWGSWLSSRNVTFSQIPREAVLCFQVMGVSDNGAPRCLAWCRMPLIDHRHRLRRGKYLLNMWEIPAFKLEKDGPKTDPYAPRAFRYRGATRDKFVKHIDADQCQLLVEFDEFAFDVIAPKYPPSNIPYSEAAVGTKLKRQELKPENKNMINDIIQKNPLEPLNMEQKQLIWMARDLLWHDPSALPVFLRSVNWTSRLHIAEAHKYLKTWAQPMFFADALEFLDYRYADTTVREMAIKWLDDMHDSELQQFLLQLVQCLKYENHHNSALARFLIRRGLKNPYQIGHFLFWHLKAEYHNLEYCERFGVIMEEYLKHAGEHSRQLFIQSTTLKRFESIAEKVFKAKHTLPPDQCKKLLKKELNKLNRDLPDLTQIPLNPRWSAKKIRVDKCRYMGSKKVPLWIVFENADPTAQDIVVMFKSGDDLRQDMLTIQMLSIMDEIWLRNKLDLHLKPYRVLATGVNKKGEGVGMLEIVLNSETINTINVENGGAFNEKAINSYLVEHNKGEHLKKARENFARSCAGYCVATFVIGIGDRHSDNIMVTKSGQFFHIDFGHFLGNFKSKFYIKRERSPFVFTRAMKYSIDEGQKQSATYAQFLTWVAEAYNVLRARSRLLLLLFALMVSAGMPELMQESDIHYFLNMLNLQLDQNRATDHIHKLVAASLNDKARVIDAAIHAAVHRDKKKKPKPKPQE